jgi:parallel beta-helix repeat protein
VPESLVWLTITLKPGEQKCIDLSDEFERPFHKELIQKVKGSFFLIFYSEEPSWFIERYSNWPPGTELIFQTRHLPNKCIVVGEETLPGTYDIRYDVTIYEEQGMYADEKTRQYLTEGTAYLRLMVTTPTASSATTPTSVLPTVTPSSTLSAATTEPHATPETATVRVVLDGSGDYTDLKVAVGDIPPGGSVSLAPGIYRLEEPLKVQKPLHLLGAGMDETIIVCEAAGFVVRFSGDGPFVAEDLTFRHEGEAVADVALVEGGNVTFSRCRFTGAVATEAEGYGAGLYLQGSTDGIVRECIAVENDGIGIAVFDQAQPTLEKNISSRNEAGILFTNNAGGIALQNECLENAFGIQVGEEAQPTLEENVCAENELVGILYGGNAGGGARWNECAGNQVGIYLSETAHPVLVENDSHDNTEADIQDRRP